MGGAMAAVLVGPWTATLAITVVLVVQCLLFADGGITALGTNVVLLAIVGAWVGWAVFWLLHTALPKRRGDGHRGGGCLSPNVHRTGGRVATLSQYRRESRQSSTSLTLWGLACMFLMDF